jgi:hypothetical protein
MLADPVRGLRSIADVDVAAELPDPVSCGSPATPEVHPYLSIRSIMDKLARKAAFSRSKADFRDRLARCIGRAGSSLHGAHKDVILPLFP